MIYIMRGISGAGKSSWIDANTPPNRIIVSADLFHMIDGKYEYRVENAEQAHRQCYLDYLEQIARGIIAQTVVVDNTNLALWELAPYVRLAQVHRLDYEITRVECDPWKAAERSLHAPANVVFKQYQILREVSLPTMYRERIVLSN